MSAPGYIPDSAFHWKEGEIAFDCTDQLSGIRGLVVRGPFCWCAYVGVEPAHLLHDLSELNFRCHYGIVIRGTGDDRPVPSTHYWWGWDYGHHLDRIFFPPSVESLLAQLPCVPPSGKDWGLAEVQQDVLDVMASLRQALEAAAERARDISHGRQVRRC